MAQAFGKGKFPKGYIATVSDNFKSLIKYNLRSILNNKIKYVILELMGKLLNWIFGTPQAKKTIKG